MIVFGYTHDIQKKFKIQDIPIDIIRLCLLYFAIIESFDPNLHSDDIELSANDDGVGNMIISPRPVRPYWCMAYGSYIIDAAETPKSVIKWSVKFHSPNTDTNRVFAIGINTEDPDSFNSYGFGGVESDNYGLHVIEGGLLDLIKDVHNNGEAHVPEDTNDKWLTYGAENILDIILNIPDKTMRFIINNNDTGYWFENIEFNDKYRLAVATYQPSEMKIEIIGFTIAEKT